MVEVLKLAGPCVILLDEVIQHKQLVSMENGEMAVDSRAIELGDFAKETIRILAGKTKVYIRGKSSNPDMLVPAGKDPFYTARQEILLNPGEQYTVPPGIEHWFQGGPEGSVNICFQNRVDENQNRFWDPKSSGCPIGPNDR